MKSCQNSFEALASTFLFVCQKVQTLSKISPPIPNFVIFCHPKLSACYNKQVSNDFAAKNTFFLLSKNENLVNFVKNQYFLHDLQFLSFRQFFITNEILWSLTIS